MDAMDLAVLEAIAADAMRRESDAMDREVVDAVTEVFGSHSSGALSYNNVGIDRSVAPLVSGVSYLKDARPEAYTQAVWRACQHAIYQLGREIRDMARRAAPVDTGAMRASVYVTRPGTALQASAGYWRAINASARLSRGRLMVHTSPEFVRDVRTQARRNAPRPGTAGDAADAGYENYNADYDFMPMQRAGAAFFHVVVGVAAYYAGYVESGTARVPARPFFGPAARWGMSEAPRRLAAAVREVRGVGGRG